MQNTFFSFASVLLATASILTIVFGWKVLYKNARRISTRSETFTLIQELMRRIDVLKNIAIELHHERDPIKKFCMESAISPEIRFIRTRLLHLEKHGRIEVNVNRIVISLRRATTLVIKKFDKDIELQGHVNAIHSTFISFQEEIYESFEKIYKPEH